MFKKGVNMKRFGRILKKLASLSVILAGFSMPGFARDVTEISVENMNSWQESFDIEHKLGKFNVVVTAKDMGGNVTLGGPFNIYIDPKSDLPVVGITNPAPYLRVPGNLNIVGTCIDDDAVEYVELIFDGNKDNPVRAKGKEFWSYFLDTSNLEEGTHIIEAYGVDINGLKGNTLKLLWVLDREQPVTAVNNMSLGTIVSGGVTLSGNIIDGNGIARLDYSLDNAEHFLPAKISTKKNSPEAHFKISFDSNKLEDGPKVIWFKATDTQGSVGWYSFLCFVDNTKPDLNIVYPVEKQVMTGVFSVAGYARDVIGLKSLTYEFNGEKGEFELAPGNPYWSVEFTNEKVLKSGKFIITAEDNAGNVKKIERNINLQPALGRPKVVVEWPKPNETLTYGKDFFIRGLAAGDAPVTKVKVDVDGSTVETVETNGAFYVPIHNSLSYGKHKVTVTATNRYGVDSLPVSVDFNCGGDAPGFTSMTVKGGTNPGNVKYGALISPEQNGTIDIEAESSVGIDQAYFTISMGDKEIKKIDVPVKSGQQRVLYSVPVTSLPWGVVKLEYFVRDTVGRENVTSNCIYVENLTKVKNDITTELPEFIENKTKNEEDGSETLIYSARVESVDGEPYKKGMMVTVPQLVKDGNRMMRVAFNCSEPVTLAYKISGKARPGETANIEGKAVVVRPDKTSPEQYADINLSGLPSRANLIEFTVGFGKKGTEKFAAVILTNRDKSESDIEDTKKIFWISDNNSHYSAGEGGFVITGGVQAAYLNAPGPVTASIAGGSARLNVSVDGNAIFVNCTEAGVYRNIVLRAVDANGTVYNSAPATLIVTDNGSKIEITSPTPNQWIRNSISLRGRVTDEVGIQKIEYSINGGQDWNLIPSRNSATAADLWVDIPVASLEDGIVPVDIHVVNASGYETYWHGATVKDVVPPEVTVVIPEPGATVNGITTVGFVTKDDGVVVKSEYVPPAGGRVTTHVDVELSSMPVTVVGSSWQPISPAMNFVFTDAAGNKTTVNQYDFTIDAESDLPVTQINLPEENAVVTKDFKVSGTLFDDDGPCTVNYRIDNRPWVELEGDGYSFSFDVPISSLTDNEHTITVYAIDINGVRGPAIVRNIRVSLEEPKSEMWLPEINTTQRGIVTLSGVASDKNGIQKIEISLDNENSFNMAEGTTSWKYTFDSRALEDGTHVVFVRATDNYGIQSLYSSLVNLDNTKPELKLELPLDDSKSNGTLFFSGYTYDNIGLTSLYITITSLEGRAVSSRYSKIDVVPDKVITTAVDISSLESGLYNVKLTGTDAAGNISSVSRNVTLDKRVAAASVEVYYPLNGEHKNGEFNIVGKVDSEYDITSATLFVDGKSVQTVDLSETDYFKFPIGLGEYEDGVHSYKVRATLPTGATVESITQTFEYSKIGPWISIDNFDYGAFAFDRPYIKGSAGYNVSEEELAQAKSKHVSKEFKEMVAAKSVSYIDISLDNGKTFTRLSTKDKWKYRIENEDLHEGYHFLLVRAVMKNGEQAITRCVVQIDRTAPYVRVISPGVGGRYNQKLDFSGLANDSVGLNSVTLSLRKGDKAGYELPSFIQGLYLDASFWGATFFSTGVGLTFFDDNVRLQFQWGQFTQDQRNIFHQSQMRYGGDAILGAKLIANIANLPFMVFGGRDLEWLSASFAVGANFSYFNETASGKPQMLSAILAQIEFPRMHFKKAKAFKTISLYSEFQLWFIPTDVSSEVDIKNMVFQFSEGIRVNIF